MFPLCLYLSFLHLKPDFKYTSLNFVRLRWGKTSTDKLEITGKISLELDSNSSLLVEYARYCWNYSFENIDIML